MITLTVSTEVRPSEDPDVVHEALETLYPFPQFERREIDDLGTFSLTGVATGVEALQDLFQKVRQQRIVQTIRNQLLSIMDLNNNSVEFMINKQALTRGKISYCRTARESPLGPVYVKICGRDIEKIVDYLFPQTKNGKVLDVDYVPNQ